MMDNATQRRYAAHLDLLVAELASGKISQGTHDVRRAATLALVGQEMWPPKVKYLVTYAVVMSVVTVILLLIGLISVLVGE